jgi:hypothetical protein
VLLQEFAVENPTLQINLVALQWAIGDGFAVSEHVAEIWRVRWCLHPGRKREKM